MTYSSAGSSKSAQDAWKQFKPRTQQNNGVIIVTIEIKDFEKLELKVGEIIKAEEIAGTDMLYKLEVDVGGRQVTLVAGIKKSYKREKLPGKKIVVVTNLRPTLIKGVTSEGMLLAAVKGENVRLVTVDGDVEVGTDVA